MAAETLTQAPAGASSETRATPSAALLTADAGPRRGRRAAPPAALTPGAPVIELAGATKVYRTGSIEFTALHEIDLTIAAGSYVAIVGPSGSGKSTLMNIIGCLDTLTAGSYHLAGEDVHELDEADLAVIRNQRIGFVFQQFNLLASMSAWHNVEVPLLYAGVRRQERRRRAVEALELVGLGDKLNNRPGELSGGQQQRVAVARALVCEPSIVLADEPTGNLDSTSTGEALELFDSLSRAGRTIVLITHEPDVAAHAGRVIHVRDGRIASDETKPTSRAEMSGETMPNARAEILGEGQPGGAR